jgi:hypothetical protein
MSPRSSDVRSSHFRILGADLFRLPVGPAQPVEPAKKPPAHAKATTAALTDGLAALQAIITNAISRKTVAPVKSGDTVVLAVPESWLRFGDRVPSKR